MPKFHITHRDGNRTEPEPNTRNSNPVSCRTEPNPNSLLNRTEPEPQMASKRTEPNEPTLLEPNPAQSLNSQLGDVKAILAGEKQYEKLEILNSVDEKLLWDLVEFLHPFHTATVQVSRDKVPTSPDVWPKLLRLKSLCRVSGTDSDSMQDLKTSFLSAMEKKYIVHPLHKLATVLNPAYKFLSFATADGRDHVCLKLRQQVDQFPLPALDDTKLSCRRETARCFVFVCSQLQHTCSAV